MPNDKENDLTEALHPVSLLDPMMIPAPLRGWLTNMADNMRAPLEFCAAGAIITLSSVIGSRIHIKPKEKDMYWMEAGNLWGLLVASPSMLKTPCVTQILHPLKELEKDANDEYKLAVVQWETKGWSTKTAKEQNKPGRKRYIVNDTTIEALATIQEKNPNGVLLHRDEIVGWLNTMDQEKHNADRAYFLECWAGKGQFRVDRQSREGNYVKNLCLSVIGTIQPDPLVEFIQESGGNKSKAGDGFIQRFQMSVYPDPVEFEYVDLPIDYIGRERALKIFKSIPKFNFFGDNPPQVFDGTPYLKYAPDAQDCFIEWLVKHQRRLKDENMASVMSSHLAKYRKLVPTLSLIFHIIEMVDDESPVQPGDPITMRSLTRAIVWSKFLEEHAKRIYSCQHLNETYRLLKKKITSNIFGSSFTLRTILQKKIIGLQVRADITEALDEMVEWGYLSEELAIGERGGRPTTKYSIISNS